MTMAALAAQEPARMSAPSIKNMIDRFRNAPATDRDKRERLRLSGAEAEDWWKHTVDDTDPTVRAAQENMHHLADTVVPRLRPAPAGEHTGQAAPRAIPSQDPNPPSRQAKRWDVVPVSPVQSGNQANGPAHSQHEITGYRNTSRRSGSPRGSVASAYVYQAEQHTQLCF
jgi:hypothetical protein